MVYRHTVCKATTTCTLLKLQLSSRYCGAGESLEFFCRWQDAPGPCGRHGTASCPSPGRVAWAQHHAPVPEAQQYSDGLSAAGGGAVRLWDLS